MNKHRGELQVKPFSERPTRQKAKRGKGWHPHIYANIFSKNPARNPLAGVQGS
jgi:hypothetical protein